MQMISRTIQSNTIEMTSKERFRKGIEVADWEKRNQIKRSAAQPRTKRSN